MDQPSGFLKTLFSQSWLPPVLTGGLGLITGLITASLNADQQRNKFFLEKQALVADQIAQSGATYVENWRRMITLKKLWLAEKRDPTAEEREIFAVAIRERGLSRDKLFSSLDASVLYFDGKLELLTREFREWDEQQATKTIEQLPELQEWRNRMRTIFSSMRRELSSH